MGCDWWCRVTGECNCRWLDALCVSHKRFISIGSICFLLFETFAPRPCRRLCYWLAVCMVGWRFCVSKQIGWKVMQQKLNKMRVEHLELQTQHKELVEQHETFKSEAEKVEKQLNTQLSYLDDHFGVWFVFQERSTIYCCSNWLFCRDIYMMYIRTSKSLTDGPKIVSGSSLSYSLGSIFVKIGNN